MTDRDRIATSRRHASHTFSLQHDVLLPRQIQQTLHGCYGWPRDDMIVQAEVAKTTTIQRGNQRTDSGGSTGRIVKIHHLPAAADRTTASACLMLGRLPVSELVLPSSFLEVVVFFLPRSMLFSVARLLRVKRFSRRMSPTSSSASRYVPVRDLLAFQQSWSYRLQ